LCSLLGSKRGAQDRRLPESAAEIWSPAQRESWVRRQVIEAVVLKLRPVVISPARTRASDDHALAAASFRCRAAQIADGTDPSKLQSASASASAGRSGVRGGLGPPPVAHLHRRGVHVLDGSALACSAPIDGVIDWVPELAKLRRRHVRVTHGVLLQHRRTRRVVDASGKP
jgi:hypothetical protein